MDEDIERAIQFLLNKQAEHNIRLAKLEELVKSVENNRLRNSYLQTMSEDLKVCGEQVKESNGLFI